MDETTRLILIISAFIVLLIGFVSFFVIMFKVLKLRNKIKQNNNNLEQELKKGKEQDFVPIRLEENEEDVEFVINSIIRNKYTSVLLLNKMPLPILKKIEQHSNANIIIDSQYWSELELEEIRLFKNVTIQSEDKFSEYNMIVFLNYKPEDMEQLFIKYDLFLKPFGMMVFNNTNNLKKQVKLLTNKIYEYKYKYDILKWYKGFVIIVKEKVNYGK